MMGQARAHVTVGLLVAVSSAICATAHAADRFFVYDLTTSTTFTGVFLAPAGSEKWGDNQALNDKDHALDPTERLALKGIERGRFDVKLVDRGGRTCIKRGIDLTRDTSFDIRDGDLAGCVGGNDQQGNKRP